MRSHAAASTIARGARCAAARAARSALQAAHDAVLWRGATAVQAAWRAKRSRNRWPELKRLKKLYKGRDTKAKRHAARLEQHAETARQELRRRAGEDARNRYS